MLCLFFIASITTCNKETCLKSVLIQNWFGCSELTFLSITKSKNYYFTVVANTVGNTSGFVITMIWFCICDCVIMMVLLILSCFSYSSYKIAIGEMFLATINSQNISN